MRTAFSRPPVDLIGRGHGLIIAMPHMGNWELIAYLATKVSPAPRHFIVHPARPSWTM